MLTLVESRAPDTSSAIATMQRVDPARRLVGVARQLHNRWRRLGPADRERLDELAGAVKERALELRGAADPARASRELERSNRELADALVDCAESDPEVDAIEVRRLRSELADELERLASAEIEARGAEAQEEATVQPAGTAGKGGAQAKRAPWL